MAPSLFLSSLAIATLPITLSAQISLNPDEATPQKVVGGYIADSQEYPWVIELTDNNGEHICGASLIAPQWVVTAGHCGQGMPGFIDPPTMVRLNPFQSSNPQASTEIIAVDQIFVFPGYDVQGNTYRPDVSLIRLVSPAQTHDPVAVITDASDLSLTEAGDSCTVLGWGSTDANGTQSDFMKQGNMVIIDQNFAASAHTGNPLFDMDTTICAGYLNGTPAVGAGAGDSGGPLFVRKNQEPLLIGVVSGGGGVITTAEQPGIYTKLFTVREWMDGIMNQSATITEFPENSLSVYLGEGLLTIDSKMQTTDQVNYSLLQLNGQLVQSGTFPLVVGKTSINLQQEPAPGAYFLILESGNYRSQSKIMQF